MKSFWLPAVRRSFLHLTALSVSALAPSATAAPGAVFTDDSYHPEDAPGGPSEAHPRGRLISGLYDVADQWDGQSTMQLSVHHCVASRTGRYEITIWGPLYGPFAIYDVGWGGVRAIPFRVSYADQGGSFREANAGVPILAQVTPDTNPNNGCNASMELRITIESAALAQARADSYLGSLIVTVS